MAISENLKNKVSNKDIVGIRDNLFGLLAFDLGLHEGGKFDEALKYCLSNGISEFELFEKDDGAKLPTEITEENKKTICKLIGRNFSKEKLAAAKRMGKILYPEEEKKTQSQSRTQTGSRTYSKRRESENAAGFLDEIPDWAKIGLGIVAAVVAITLGIRACSK